MNLKQLITFGIEESQEPVIKNPILRTALQEPRTMAQAPLANELEPGALKDEMLKDFDPSQETHEEYLQRKNLERPFNMAHGGLMQPRQGFYRKGFVKPGSLTKKEIDQRYKAKKLKKDPDWSPYKEGSIYRKRIEAKEKGLVYDIKTGETREAQPTGFQKTYHKFEAADKKLIKEWKKTLTDAAKKGDMSQTTGFKDWLSKKFDSKTVNTIRARTRLKLGFFSGQEYNNAQENFVKSLIKKHNESDKLLHTKQDVWRKARFDKASDIGKRMWKLMDDPKTGLENIDTKINKAVDKIIDGNLPIRTSSKVGQHISKYSPIIQMIGEMSGAGSSRTIRNALRQNPKFKDKEFLETFNYLNRAHAKDFLGLPFDEAFEYAKFRQGGLDVKGMVSYTTRYQNPESNVMSFAVRHANRHFRDGTKSQVEFYNLKADGTRGAPMPWDKLPKNRDGNRVLDLKKVGFEYKNQFFHKNNLKTKGYKSGLFDEVYAMSGKNRLLVPDPNDLSNKITLKKLLQMTGDKLTIGHDEALGGVKGSPFKHLKLQGEKLNSALFHAYDKIQNKGLRKLVLNELELIVPKGKNYETAFIEGKIDEAKKAIDKTDTLYRGAGKKVIGQLGPGFIEKSEKFQRETLRVAGIDLSKPEGRSQLNKLIKTAKTAKGPGKLKALGALVTMLGAGAVYELGFSPTELQAAEAQAGETGVVDKAKSWPIEHPWLTGGAAVGATASVKAGRKLLGKTVGGAFGPTGIALTYPAFGMLGEDFKTDLSKPLDRAVVEGEALLAPTLVKGTEAVTKGIKNPLIRKGMERALNLGMKLPTAMKVARIASPIGLLSLAGEGIYHAGKKEMDRRAQLSPEELADFHLERQSRGWAGKKGIMGLKKKKW